ncbi:DUF6173 family protein [Eshraghiella crossota]|uniref:DUF6173 family protein n=1 Tax=Eshraghiella crossota TaxID=45851 RepID=UPI004027EA44
MPFLCLSYRDLFLWLFQNSYIFTSLLIKEIGYIGYNLVCFHGEDTSGKPLELIQHVQQLNFLLMIVPKPEPEVPKRQIGFVGQAEE